MSTTEALIPIFDADVSKRHDLEEYYNTLPREIVNVCKEHTLGIQNAIDQLAAHLAAIRDVLTENGYYFKDWCAAAGVPYSKAMYLVNGRKNAHAKYAEIKSLSGSSVVDAKTFIRAIDKWGDFSKDESLHRFYNDMCNWLRDISDDKKYDVSLTLKRVSFLLDEAVKKFGVPVD